MITNMTLSIIKMDMNTLTGLLMVSDRILNIIRFK